MSLIQHRGMTAEKFSPEFGVKGSSANPSFARLGIGKVRSSASATNWRLGRISVSGAGRGAPAPNSRSALSGHMFVVLTRVADLMILLISGFLATEVCSALGMSGVAGEPMLATMAASLATVFVLNQADAYAPSRLRNAPRRLRAIGIGVATGGAAAIVCYSLMPVTDRTLRLWPLVWMMSAGLLTTGAALFTAQAARALSRAEKLARRVAVVGVGDYSNAFIRKIAEDPERVVTFVGLYDDGENGASPVSGSPVMGNVADLIARSRRERLDAIVLTLPLSDQPRVMRTRNALRCVTADIYMAGELLECACKTSQVDRLGPNAVIKIGSRPLTEWESLQKTVFDWVVSAILFVAVLPFLGLIALAIRLDSPGPVLFRQPRLGFNNNMFNVFKFRTMFHHMADLTADRQTTRNDARVTRVGRILRKTSLDEVPQLINVLKGEMSLVGPRPHAINTKAGDQLFHDAVADYALRHRVKPGITGWAQVNGWRGETRTVEDIEQRVAHDLHYIDNWSFMLDIKILVLTALRELNSKVAF